MNKGKFENMMTTSLRDTRTHARIQVLLRFTLLTSQ